MSDQRHAAESSAGPESRGGEPEPEGILALSSPLSALCYFIFFLSGAAALVYQISWSRQIGLLFGHTVHAAAIVLGSYFAGMAVGYLVGAKWSSRVSPLAGYGVAELIAAAGACLVPGILSLVETTPAFRLLVSSSAVTQTWLRGLFCFALLSPATVALGATLPFMAELLSPNNRTAARRVSWAYALNTLGAFTGVLLATLFLLVTVGVRSSNYLAAGLSALCGLSALAMTRLAGRAKERDGLHSPLEESSSRRTGTAAAVHPDRVWWSIVAACCGFGTLALEVLYTRLFSLVFHNSTYTFGIVVAVFLAGLALGAAVVSWIGRRVAAETLLSITAWLGAISIGASVTVFVWYTQLEYFAAGDSFRSYLLGSLALVAFIVLTPVVLLGMLLPTAWQALGQSGGGGRVVGRLTTVNTLAAAAGSLSASFVMLPALGLWASFGLVAAVFAAVAGFSLLRQRQRGLSLLGGLSSVLLVIYLGTGSGRWIQAGSQNDRIVKRWESAYGWIDVVRDPGDGSRKVRQNLHYRLGATGPDAVRERRQAHLPLLLHDQPHDVLMLGLGTGVTVAGALPHPEVKDIFVVELIPEVVQAARMLAELNGGIVDRNVHVRVDDARHYLLASDRRFDVIVSDLFVPWESETGYLYTVENYRLARGRLKPRGLFCQWLPLYQMGAGEFELIADSFSSVFPATTIWWRHLDAAQPIVALVGSGGALQIDSARLARRLAALQRDADGFDDSLRTVARLSGLYLGDWTPRRPHRLNTDEHPRVEFLTPISHRDERLLYGLKLMAYFDSVLAKLPSDGVLIQPHAAPLLAHIDQIRARQRFILFGETPVGIRN